MKSESYQKNMISFLKMAIVTLQEMKDPAHKPFDPVNRFSPMTSVDCAIHWLQVVCRQLEDKISVDDNPTLWPEDPAQKENWKEWSLMEWRKACDKAMKEGDGGARVWGAMVHRISDPAKLYVEEDEPEPLNKKQRIKLLEADIDDLQEANKELTRRVDGLTNRMEDLVAEKLRGINEASQNRDPFNLVKFIAYPGTVHPSDGAKVFLEHSIYGNIVGWVNTEKKWFIQVDTWSGPREVPASTIKWYKKIS